MLSLALSILLAHSPLGSKSSSDSDKYVELIRAHVQKYSYDLKQCASYAAGRGSTQLMVRFTFTGSRRTADVEPVTAIKNTALSNCVMEVVRNWRFIEPPCEDKCTFTYPFVFRG